MINCAVDVETTGLVPGVHEVVQMAIVILDKDFNLTGDRFFSNIRVQRPEVADPAALEVNGIDLSVLEKTAPTLLEMKRSLFSWKNELFEGEKLYAIFHNAIFDIPFLKLALQNLYDEVFHYQYRDSCVLARAMIDAGLLNSKSASLGKLTEVLGLTNDRPHHALEDSKACAVIYRELIKRLGASRPAS